MQRNIGQEVSWIGGQEDREQKGRKAPELMGADNSGSRVTASRVRLQDMTLSTLPRTQAQMLLAGRWDICLGCEMPSVRNSFITKSQCVHWE